MNHIVFKTFVPVVMGAALLTACGGGTSHEPMAQGTAPAEPPPAVTVAVPAEVTTSPVAATSYVASLSSEPESSTDVLEPVEVPEQIAQDDSAEPV